jgi:hypothetical protein
VVIPVRTWASIAVVIAALGLGWLLFGRVRTVTQVHAARPELAAPKPAESSELADPFVGGRAPALDRIRTLAPDWVSAPPLEQFQYSLDSATRGVEPCSSPAPPEARKLLAPLGEGYLYVPESAQDNLDRFNLVVHLHGQEPVLRELVASKRPFVLYALTLPVGKSYAPAFSGPALLPGLLAQIEAAVGERTGRPARLEHLAVSAWSAGFEGVRAILSQPEEPRLDAIVLIDGLHAPREPRALEARLAPFVAFALRAAAGERAMIVTHSSIRTPDYASTTETAHRLVAALGGQPLMVWRDDGFGLELVESFTRGELYVRGYAGNDKADHCAQLFLLRNAFAVLGERWSH